MSSSLLQSTAMLQFLAAYMVVVITPGPVALATGSLASLRGFNRTIPLIAGIGTGTGVLAGLMALGAAHLALSLSLPGVKVAGAAVLGWLAWRIATTSSPAENPTGRPRKLRGGLIAGGFLIGALSPECATFFAVAFSGRMLPIGGLGDALAVAAIVGCIDVCWHGFMAVLLSRAPVRAAVLRCHRAICRTAATLLAGMALFTAVSAVAAI